MEAVLLFPDGHNVPNVPSCSHLRTLCSPYTAPSWWAAEQALFHHWWTELDSLMIIHIHVCLFDKTRKISTHTHTHTHLNMTHSSQIQTWMFEDVRTLFAVRTFCGAFVEDVFFSHQAPSSSSDLSRLSRRSQTAALPRALRLFFCWLTELFEWNDVTDYQQLPVS